MINILLKIALYDYWEAQTNCLPLQPGARWLGQHSLKLDIYWAYFILFYFLNHRTELFGFSKPRNWNRIARGQLQFGLELANRWASLILILVRFGSGSNWTMVKATYMFLVTRYLII